MQKVGNALILEVYLGTNRSEMCNYHQLNNDYAHFSISSCKVNSLNPVSTHRSPEFGRQLSQLNLITSGGTKLCRSSARCPPLSLPVTLNLTLTVKLLPGPGGICALIPHRGDISSTVVPTGDGSASQETFGNVRPAGAGGEEQDTGIWWVEASDAVKHPTLHRTAPTAKKDATPSVNSAKVEKPCPG